MLVTQLLTKTVPNVAASGFINGNGNIYVHRGRKGGKRHKEIGKCISTVALDVTVCLVFNLIM